MVSCPMDDAPGASVAPASTVTDTGMTPVPPSLPAATLVLPVKVLVAFSQACRTKTLSCWSGTSAGPSVYRPAREF